MKNFKIYPNKWTSWKSLKLLVMIAIIGLVLITINMFKSPVIAFSALPDRFYDYNPCELPSVECNYKETENITMTTTAYNTVPEQTWGNPCLAFSGDNICGRDDVVACPRKYPIGTQFKIKGKVYTCLDRLHPRYDNRIDISFDKDLKSAKEFGKQQLIIEII